MSKISDSVLESATALASLDALVSGSNPSTAELTKLVQQVIDISKQTQGLLQKAYDESLKGSGSSNNQVATNLPSALANVTNTINKLQNLNNEVKASPYLPQFRAGNSRQTNIMNGFYTKWGYKQFFGKKRNIGLRYYGFFSYNGASVGFRETSNSVGLYTYGVGTDVLYNIFERSYQNKSVNMGVFGGIQLAGETFNSSLKNSQYVNKKDINSTHFQFLFDLGFRMNFGKLGQKTKRHRQHTVEIGVQVPTIYNTYYKSAGTTVRYFRPYSVYWSYGYSF